MKNQYVIMFLTIVLLLLSANAIFAEDTSDNNNSISDNSFQQSDINENQIETLSNEVTDIDSKYDENILIDSIEGEYYFIIHGHTQNIDSSKLEIRDGIPTPSKHLYSLDCNNDNFTIDVTPTYHNLIPFYLDNKYLTTLTFNYSYTNDEIIADSIKFNKTPYIEYDEYMEYDKKFILFDGSYFNQLIEKICEKYDNQNVSVYLKDNVYLNEPFNWNNKNINLTISGYNFTEYIWEHEFEKQPYYTFSIPSIAVGENSDLTLTEITLNDTGVNDHNFIINDGTLTLYSILYKNSANNPSTESFLIVNNATLNIQDYFNTKDYSTETKSRNLIYNKNLVKTDLYWFDINFYELNFETDMPNYIIYNEGQVKIMGKPMDNTEIISNSGYEYAVTYQKYTWDMREYPINISGKNVLLDNVYITSNDTINVNNLTIKSSYICGADINAENLQIIDSSVISNTFDYLKKYYYDENEEYYDYYFTINEPETPFSLNLNVTNLTAINNIFRNPVFENDILKAKNIKLESNIFEFDEIFEKATTAKTNDHNKVELMYENLIYKNNTLNNFEFIKVDTTSNTTNNTDGTATKNQENNKKLFKNGIIQKDKSYKNTKKTYQNNVVTLKQNDEITLSWLNNIFDNDFSNQKILIYIGDILVFNGSVGSDISEVLFNITKEYKGTYTLKVIANNSTFTKEVNII